MNYKETTDYLFKQLPMYQRIGKAAYKADLNTTLELDDYFNNPHKNYKTVHVAGTNGKGSVSHILASIFQKTGLKVGLYTSPHLTDFRERIRINGTKISKEYVIDFVEKHKDVIENIKASFFEITAAMAFDYFDKERVDVAVIEVGMGGRLDSTNIISPELSVITNIGLDHTKFLGDSIQKIAGEKAGIIKENTPVVIGRTQEECKNIFMEFSNEKKSKIYFADSHFKLKKSKNSEDSGIYNVFKDDNLYISDLKTDLLGDYQKENIATSLQAIDLLSNQFIISKKNIYNGLKTVNSSTGLRGRWQIIRKNPTLICDSGHNEEGIKSSVKQLSEMHYNRLHIIFGMVNDKDTEKILQLLPKNAIYYFAEPSIPRKLNVEKLHSIAKQIGLKGESFQNIGHAYNTALKNSKEDDIIFVGGSTFTVSDFLRSFSSHNSPKL